MPLVAATLAQNFRNDKNFLNCLFYILPPIDAFPLDCYCTFRTIFRFRRIYIVLAWLALSVFSIRDDVAGDELLSSRQRTIREGKALVSFWQRKIKFAKSCRLSSCFHLGLRYRSPRSLRRLDIFSSPLVRDEESVPDADPGSAESGSVSRVLLVPRSDHGDRASRKRPAYRSRSMLTVSSRLINLGVFFRKKR